MAIFSECGHKQTHRTSSHHQENVSFSIRIVIVVRCFSYAKKKIEFNFYSKSPLLKWTDCIWELNEQTKLRHSNKYSSHSHSLSLTERDDTQIKSTIKANTKAHKKSNCISDTIYKWNVLVLVLRFFRCVLNKGIFSMLRCDWDVETNLNNSLY